MSKIEDLTDLNSLSNETSAINTINNNNDKIEAALQNTLSLDGSTPNSMLAELDMNGYRILNVPEPVADTDVATYGSVAGAVTDASDFADAAALSASEAAASESTAVTAAQEATSAASTATASEVICTAAETATESYRDEAEAFALAADVDKIVWRNAYNGATAYKINDAVSYSDSSYICILDSTGNLPTDITYWEVLALKGTDGTGAGDMLAANNLSDVADVATSRDNLGLGDLAVLDTVSASDIDAGVTDLVNDTSPQLGGNLDLNSNVITGLEIGTDIQAYDVNNSVTDVAQEFTKTQNFNETALTDAATIAWDAESNQVTQVVLAGNRTLGAPTNLVVGAIYMLTVIQDATGSRTLAYNAIYDFGAAGAPDLTTDANAEDILTFKYNGVKMQSIINKGYGL